MHVSYTLFNFSQLFILICPVARQGKNLRMMVMADIVSRINFLIRIT